MVVALELEHERPACRPACHAEGRGHGLAARGGEDRLLGAGNGRHQQLRRLDLEPVLGPEREVAVDLLVERRSDDLGGMAEDQGPVAEGEVDVAVAVDVPDRRPGAALEVQRVRPRARANRGGHATRDDPTGRVEQLPRQPETGVGHPMAPAFVGRNACFPERRWSDATTSRATVSTVRSPAGAPGPNGRLTRSIAGP